MTRVSEPVVLRVYDRDRAIFSVHLDTAVTTKL